MITLPAEVSTYKNSKKHSLISFFEIESRNFYFSSRALYLILYQGINASITYDLGYGEYILEDTSASFEDLINPSHVYYDGNYYLIGEILSNSTMSILGYSGGNVTGISYNIERFYRDILKKDSENSTKDSIPEMINGMNSYGSGKISLVNFRNEIRAELLGSDPDLTDVEILCFIKYNTDSRLHSSALNFFSAKISDWDENGDVFEINIRIDNEIYTKQLMSVKLTNSPYKSNREYYTPKQYGDFGGDLTDIQYWDEWPNKNFAFCPIRSSAIVDGKIQFRFEVSSHQMSEMPSYSEIDYDRHQARKFQFYDGMFHIPTSTRFNAESGYVVNGSSGAYFLLDYDHSDEDKLNHTMLHPTEEWVGIFYANTVTNFANAIDGKSTTSVVISGTEFLSVKNFKTDSISSGHNYDKAGLSKLEVYVQIGASLNLGSGSAVIRIVDISDGYTTVASYTVTAGDADRSVSVTKSGLNSTYDCDNYGIVIDCYNVTSITIKNIIIFTYTKGMNNESHPYMFLRCKGKMYSTTWNGRKTVGTLIENPSDFIESILRDYLGQLNIDTARFDEIHNQFSSIKICKSLYKGTSAENLFSEFAKAFYIAIFSTAQNWRLASPLLNKQNYPISGTTTPANLDIITDADSFSGNSFSKHPISKGSFALSRSGSDDVVTKLTMNFQEILDETWSSDFIGSGNVELIIENSFISDPTSADTLLTLISPWHFKQKMMASFSSFYSLIGYEIGDLINIQHDDLSASLVTASTLSQQQWLVMNVVKNYHPAKIRMKAIELV